MIVEVSRARGPQLLEPRDFRRFKLVLRDRLATSEVLIRGLTFTSETEALVGIDFVASLPGVPDDAAWRADYATMILAARRSGWIDEATNMIRAHIEWADEAVQLSSSR
jgi:hypothetical protein